jgi:hypothetical protein
MAARCLLPRYFAPDGVGPGSRQIPTVTRLIGIAPEDTQWHLLTP